VGLPLLLSWNFSLTAPPQANGEGKHHELVMKEDNAKQEEDNPLAKKSAIWSWVDIYILTEISWLITFFFLNKMIINFNMLSMKMIDSIGNKSYSTKVITPNCRSHG
jgi:hypothetical protein